MGNGMAPASSTLFRLDSDRGAAPDSERSRTETFFGPLNQFERRHAPEYLYLAGDRALLEAGRRVAIVGSRRVSRDDLDLARSVTEAVVNAGITVVSGLAEGIDTVAHRAAIELGGRTVAVIGTPLSRAYPASNAHLKKDIARHHLVVSQFPEEDKVQRQNFPMRNRTMAIISDATVIIAAAAKSGTRHQGWEAIDLGRPLAIMEPLASSGIGWIEDQIRFGAEPLCLNEIEDWFGEIHEREEFDESVF